MLYGLALHTTSSQLGLALDNFADDARAQVWDLGRDMSAYLHLYLKDFLSPQTWANLQFIAVAKGPGSFTSTRLGVVTARTLAQQLDLALFAVSSLEAIAWTQQKDYSPGVPIAVQMAARRGQLFVGIYAIEQNSGWRKVLPDTTMTPEAWQQKLDTLGTYGLIEAPTDLGNTASSLLQLAYHQWQQGDRPHWSKALPFYGQSPV